MLQRYFSIMVLLLFPCTLFANQLDQTYQYQLKNGLKIIVRVDQRAPVVLSSIWYRVGSSYEHNGITGISHMLEHMMFKGTKRFGPGQFTRIVYANGGRLNAFTSSDFTAYYEYFSANKLALSFKLESDRMHNLLLQEKDFKTERLVVMEERRMRVGDKPMSLTRERFRAAAFINNPYHHPVIGWMTDLQHMTLTNLKQWYQTWYVPNNAILVVIGDVKPEHVLTLAKQYFGSIPKGKLPIIKPRAEVKTLGTRQLIVHAPAKLPYLIMGYNVPSLVTIKHKWQAYALLVLSGVLDAGDSARFQQQLIRGRQVAASVSANYDLYDLYSTTITFSGIPAAKHTIKQLKQAIFQQIQQLKSKPVSEAELARIKAQVIADQVFQKDSLMYQAFDIGMPEAVGLSWKINQNFVKNISAITPQQIEQVARLFLTKNRLTIATLKPTKLGASA